MKKSIGNNYDYNFKILTPEFEFNDLIYIFIDQNGENKKIKGPLLEKFHNLEKPYDHR